MQAAMVALLLVLSCAPLGHASEIDLNISPGWHFQEITHRTKNGHQRERQTQCHELSVGGMRLNPSWYGLNQAVNGDLFIYRGFETINVSNLDDILDCVPREARGISVQGPDLEGVLAGMSPFGKYDNLTVLYLDQNRLTGFARGYFSNNTKLAGLSMRMTLIENLGDMFHEGFEALRWLSLAGHKLTEIQSGAFQGCHALKELFLGESKLDALTSGWNSGIDLSTLYLNHIDSVRFSNTVLSNNFCEGLENLRLLTLEDNDINICEDGAFDHCWSIGWIILTGNLLTEIPRFNVTDMDNIVMNNNNISRIGPEVNLPIDLIKISLQGNPLEAIHPNIFKGLRKLNEQTDWPLMDSFGQPMKDPKMDGRRGGQRLGNEMEINSGWVKCRLLGDTLNTTICDECNPGFVMNTATNSCQQVPFGPRLDWNGTPAFGSTDFPTILEQQKRYSYMPDLQNKAYDFVGYSNGNYPDIEYSLAFTSPVADIGCEDSVAGDTRTSTRDPLRSVPTSTVELLRMYWMSEPEHLNKRYRINVTAPGDFEFDMCDTFGTAVFTLGIYTNPDLPSRNSDRTKDAFAVGDGLQSPFFDQLLGQLPYNDTHSAHIPFQGGCFLKDLPHVTIHLDPGMYVAEIHGHIGLHDDGGEFLLKLRCSAGAASSPSNPDPGGISVNKQTGEIIGIPERVGQYYMSLVASDSANTKSIIKEWSFEVQQPPRFRTTSGWSISRQGEMDVQDIYTRGETYFIPPPVLNPEELFLDPAGGLFTEIVYIFSITALSDSSNSSDGLRQRRRSITDQCVGEILTDIKTGTAVLKLPCNGHYLGTLQARDSAGQDALVRNWSFYIKDLDTSIPSFGPNQRGCQNGGIAIDENLYDNEFTCDCNGTDYVGSNCEVYAASSETVSHATVVTVSAVGGVIIFAILIALIVTRVQLYRANLRPENMDEHQSSLLATLGMAPRLDISDDELGLLITFDHLDALKHSPAAVAQFESRLTAAFAEIKVAPSLKDAKFITNIDSHQTQIIMKRARVYVKKRMRSKNVVVPDYLTDNQNSSTADHVLAVDIGRAAAGMKLPLDNHRTVFCSLESVTLCIPKRKPREFHRKNVVRIKTLGEGAFGIVYKAQLVDHSISIPISVAVKTINSKENGGRDDLLKEAALMALFEHKHVLGLIGLVTIPRDMPPLIILPLMEHGTLNDFVRSIAERGETISTVDMLSLAHDCCQGLEYLAGHKFIHRDVACRNVLLDAQMTCKVSDFGMSAVLDDDGKEYIRLHEQLPVRWSAIEVLKEGKYSTKSDVWSFGILCWEIWSYGATPYGDLGGLAQVTDYVLQGGHLQRPENCARDIFHKVMEPCWMMEPSFRPSFSEMLKVLIRLGAQDSSEDDEHEIALTDDLTEREKKLIYSRKSSSFTMSERSLIGPSVFYLQTQFLPAAQSAMKNPHGSVEDATKEYINPVTKDSICKRDGNLGCAFIDILDERKDVGLSTAFVSFCFQYECQDIVGALVDWVDDSDVRKAESTYVWICCLCLNNHRESGVMSPDQLRHEFSTRVQAIGRVLPMLAPFEAPIYTRRAWCLFELYTSLTLGKSKCKVSFILPPSARAAFKDAIAKQGYDAIDKALGQIKAEDATATFAEDLAVINQLINDLPGGYPLLNKTLQRELRRWFTRQGAMKTAARLVPSEVKETEGRITSRETSSSLSQSECTFPRSAHAPRSLPPIKSNRQPLRGSDDETTA